jgi:hypothetical protein
MLGEQEGGVWDIRPMPRTSAIHCSALLIKRLDLEYGRFPTVLGAGE